MSRAAGTGLDFNLTATDIMIEIGRNDARRLVARGPPNGRHVIEVGRRLRASCRTVC